MLEFVQIGVFFLLDLKISFFFMFEIQLVLSFIILSVFGKEIYYFGII